ncbi:MAG: polyphosphate polymerase domain-containing protein [Lachnospiraceae bacterium]|nr:polyphosphate polymerase domain-containing protein [Lachnospiraceae bacterium]
MGAQMTFERYELKYILTGQQKEEILKAMEPYMALDEYGRTTIRNVYYDTENYRLVRKSIEKPVYKEKLRVRSYGRAGANDQVFVELKKKYRDIVYKRRFKAPGRAAADWLDGRGPVPAKNGQIIDEIAYFRDFYKGLAPACFISYEREAYYDKKGSGFRVTFDENIMARTDRLTLSEDALGVPLIPRDMTLMEIKCAGGYPLWLTRVLSRLRIYKTSFSKYGTAYQKLIIPVAAAYQTGGRKYA